MWKKWVFQQKRKKKTETSIWNELVFFFFLAKRSIEWPNKIFSTIIPWPRMCAKNHLKCHEIGLKLRATVWITRKNRMVRKRMEISEYLVRSRNRIKWKNLKGSATAKAHHQCVSFFCFLHGSTAQSIYTHTARKMFKMNETCYGFVVVAFTLSYMACIWLLIHGSEFSKHRKAKLIGHRS